MPTYEYLCKACGHKFEEFQSIKAEPVKVCPQCGTHAVQRMISGGNGLIFKGSGFYITDYKNSHNSPSNGSQKDASSTKKPEKKPSAKSEDS